jgi:hypothetical protein
MIGALGLKPTSISATGFSLAIDHPEIIQGVLYLFALARALMALSYFVTPTDNPFFKPVALRGYLWTVLPRGTKSFRNVNLTKVKEYARTSVRRNLWIHAGMTIFLILMIALKIRPLFAALVAVFSSSF